MKNLIIASLLINVIVMHAASPDMKTIDEQFKAKAQALQKELNECVSACYSIGNETCDYKGGYLMDGIQEARAECLAKCRQRVDTKAKIVKAEYKERIFKAMGLVKEPKENEEDVSGLDNGQQ